MIAFRQKTLTTTSYALLTRLQGGDDEKSWEKFFERYRGLIFSLAIRAGLTEAEAQDAVQETMICVARKLHKFQCDRSLGTFKGWLRNLTRWRIADQLRARVPRDQREEVTSDDEAGALLREIPDHDVNRLDTLWEEEWRANLLSAALQRLKGQIREKHFQMFDLYVIKQWPVAKVARRLGVSAAQVYLAKHRISALVKREVEAMQKQPF